ncbi:cupin domain-containing protein [Streptomyces longispororuber]|uniref:JmjC domain-containing protein n=1 Tax=Streptomyces TaxID=1883 RepID=UPI0024A87D06|nr:cupin domain-containing protein [Streptomyces sp. CC224B]
MAVEKLLDDPSKLKSIRDTEPYVSRDMGDLDQVFSTDLAQRLLFERGLRTPYIRLWRHGQDIGVRKATKPGDDGSDERRVLSGLADPAYVVSQMRQGATLVFQAMSTYCPEVEAFCAELSEDIGVPVAANAFLTPPHSKGAEAHYDLASIFLRQLAGSKTWRLHEPPKQWPVKRSKPGVTPQTPQCLEVTLHAGDCLYLPRGFYHEGTTAEEGSVHIAFSDGVEDNWTQILHDALELVAERSVALRGRLPSTAEALSGASKEMWKEVREDLFRTLEDLGDEVISALVVRRLKAREQQLKKAETASLGQILAVESPAGDA